MSASAAAVADPRPRSLARALLSPFSVLMGIYFVYLSLVYSGIYKYAFWELMNLGTRIMGFRPMPFTVALYFYGAVVIVCGFIGGLLVAKRVDAMAVGEGVRRLATWLRGVWERVSALPVLRTFGAAYVLSLMGWLFCFGANVAQDVIGGISLTDIASRWAQSPIIVFFALGQIFFVPALMVSARDRKQFALSILLFFVSVAGLVTLGARHMPAKLIIAVFLAAVYIVKPQYLWRLAIAFLVLLVLALGFVGALSKQGIYGAAASAKLVLGLTYSDSASTVSNFDRIVAMTPSTGIYRGGLLRDSILAAVPRAVYGGEKPDYANYQLGRYLGGRKYFVINDQRIDRSVSLAPTMLGAAYADWGVPGVILQMLVLGFIFGYLQERAHAALLLVPFLVTYASYAIHAVNVGVHNPHAHHRDRHGDRRHDRRHDRRARARARPVPGPIGARSDTTHPHTRPRGDPRRRRRADGRLQAARFAFVARGPEDGRAASARREGSRSGTRDAVQERRHGAHEGDRQRHREDLLDRHHSDARLRPDGRGQARGVARAEQAGHPARVHASTTSGSACLISFRTRASVSPRQSPNSLIRASICWEGERSPFASFEAVFAFVVVAFFMILSLAGQHTAKRTCTDP